MHLPFLLFVNIKNTALRIGQKSPDLSGDPVGTRQAVPLVSYWMAAQSRRLFIIMQLQTETQQEMGPMDLHS